ncbi:unnamed protein product [Adineta steineri]|uniref:Uncharacterized protein n=1 Tax=Adineta steineri TaxID=433720 RepID=A0A815F6K3_9BILA|nr:unnamed protein product [Adineta steineri]CAF4195214.1 unnamed protein product [Adineta steineri]
MDCCYECDCCYEIDCCDPYDDIQITYVKTVPICEEIICVDAKPRKCCPEPVECCVEYITCEIDPCDICW